MSVCRCIVRYIPTWHLYQPDLNVCCNSKPYLYHNIMLDVRCWKTNLGFKRSNKQNLDTTITLRLQVVSLQYNIFHMILHYSFAFRSALWWISVSTKNKYNFKIYFIWARIIHTPGTRIIKPHAPHTAI